MSFKGEKRQETIIYLALWALLFLAPVLSLAIRTSNTDRAFDWSEILTVWKQFALFLLVFLIHNHLMAPLLIYKQKKQIYLGLCLTIVAIFQVYQCNHRPNFRNRGPRFEVRERDERPPMPPDFHEGRDKKPDIAPWEREPRRPPLMFGQHDIISIIILILMLGMNLGIKLYFKQRTDQKQLEELERQNLEQQLEYLKYQINPHFFMNTLNNIHALVDIDPEKAKSTILELSKMMRFVLYEGNKKGVPLDREISFLQNYITLMKLRYTDMVRIKVDVPASLPNKEVPPLMFITFVENAFKHGVSYRQESFIDIQIAISDGKSAISDWPLAISQQPTANSQKPIANSQKLIFTCKNSRLPASEDKHGGVGLANVRQRLDLIYGNDYTLDIEDKPDIYTVILTIPL